MHVKAELTALWGWWINELLEMSRSAVGRIAPRFTRRVLITFRETECLVTRPGGTRDEVLRIAKSELREWPSLPADLSPEFVGADAVVVLAPEDVLTYDIRVPVSLERDLASVVALRVEQDLPLLREDVVSDYRIVRRDRRSRTLVLQVVVAQRRKVEARRQLAEQWGFRPIRIAVQDEHGSLFGDLGQLRPRSALVLTPLDRRLVVSASALAVAWVAVAGAHAMYERWVVGRAAGDVERAALAVDALEAELRAASAPAVALAKVIDSADALDVLLELTRVVPDDAWIFDLEIDAPIGRAPGVKLGAFASAAPALAQMLEESPKFTQVEVDVAIPAGAIAPKDRLRLAAVWEPTSP